MAASPQKQRQRNGKGDGRENGIFIALPHAVIKSAAWRGLTPKAKVLLIELFIQYNGHNNGNLCAAPKTMAEFGWKGNSTLPAARQELEHSGLIILTKQGGRNRPNLYAVTWKAINECGGKLEHPPTKTPLGYWRLGYNPECKKQPPKIDATLPPNGTNEIDSTLPPDGIKKSDNTATR